MTHRKLGISGDKKSRVYLQQNLPAGLYKVLKKSLDHKKNGLISRVKISTFGDVMIRVGDKDRFIPIRSSDDLQDAVAPNK